MEEATTGVVEAGPEEPWRAHFSLEVPPYPFKCRARYLIPGAPEQSAEESQRPAVPSNVHKTGRRPDRIARLLRHRPKLLRDFPLEIVLEVFAHMGGQGLLSMSRLTRGFRSILISESSEAIWMRALDNVPEPFELPKRPPDMSLLYYASMLYEDTCKGCGAQVASIYSQPELELNVYTLGMRLCPSCKASNLISVFHEDIYDLVDHWLFDEYDPQDVYNVADLKLHHRLVPTQPFNLKYKSISNPEDLFFFVPEARCSIKHFADLQDTTGGPKSVAVAELLRNRDEYVDSYRKFALGLALWDGKRLIAAREEILKKQQLANEESIRLDKEANRFTRIILDSKYHPSPFGTTAQDRKDWKQWCILAKRLPKLVSKHKECRQTFATLRRIYARRRQQALEESKSSVL